MPTKTINGVTIFYTDTRAEAQPGTEPGTQAVTQAVTPAGRGSGPALVLLHGFPLDGRMWRRQVEGLAEVARVIAPDYRGFGRSTAPGDDPAALAFTIESLADDVHALASDLGIVPFVLGGLSMGGYVALAYTKKYPATLRGLVLLDTRADADTADAKQARQGMIELARAAGPKAVAQQMLPKLLAENTLKHRPNLVKEVREMAEGNSAAAIAAALAAMRDRPDQTAALGAIRVPTLVMVGDADALTPPAVAEGMHRAIPQSQLAVLRGAGHMSPLEQPEQANGALRKFLPSLPRPRSPLSPAGG